MNMQATLLIVDDDVDIRNLLGAFLRPHGYETHLASDGVEMQRILASHAVDLIILDIMLPGVDGLTLCRQLRTHSAVPIIMLTAIGEEVDRIVGLEMGADDYLNKPFHPRELLARIKAVLRRAQNSAYEKVSNKNPIYHFAGWKLDTGARRLISPDQLEVSVTSGEYDLLIVFLEHPQAVLSRDHLLDATKNRLAEPFDRSIDIQISRLRHKIEEDIKNPTILKTVRSGGYVLVAPVETHHD
ncbi:MAG: DNA-binding response regulator [Gammaproteobacteria bacterium RIFCSPHIGHO2_02_FULL_39_13]|nr:MAG: DNA-binding response regulator [Gammaproteobacteria bacterium RIFCSPHIGHO2_02_FULL_39_13]OGT48389.1 MAG: DNA-binding response regulator [Gammaproteobacteria bacterium RIFCSPHIGHO2_12_FULL_39_24]